MFNMADCDVCKDWTDLVANGAAADLLKCLLHVSENRRLEGKSANPVNVTESDLALYFGCFSGSSSEYPECGLGCDRSTEKTVAASTCGCCFWYMSRSACTDCKMRGAGMDVKNPARS